MFAGIMVGSVLVARYAVKVHKSRRKEELPGAISWLDEVKREPLKLDPGKPRIMLAARGRDQAEFAVDLAGQRNATLFVIFIRTLRLLNVSEGATPRIEDDPDAQEALGTVTMLARQRGVACVPIYVSSPNIADEILDYTVTFGCDTLIIGRSKRSGLSRSVEGDVVSEIKKHLPSLVNLIERDRTGPLHADGTMLPDAPTSGDVGQGEKK
jgi:nucleotide-binding universal stress UspA family protein